MSDQAEKSDSPERVEEREDRRLPFSLADSRTVNWAWESGRLRRGMARGEVDEGMWAVGGLIFQPLEFPFLPFFLIRFLLFKREYSPSNEKTARSQIVQAVYGDPVTQ